jgi:hypothetical protein
MVHEKKFFDRVFDIFSYVFLVALAFYIAFIHTCGILSATAPSMGGFVKFWPIVLTDQLRKILVSPWEFIFNL